MCGISGVIALDGRSRVDAARLTRASDSIRHRGPDDSGTFVSPAGTVGLAHRRLSIIDLTTGHQPMSTPDGRRWLVFNGEIYNYRELRAELLKTAAFRTTSDTEVILQLFRAHGARAFDLMNGIFALAIYDADADELTLARDHFGVKPLYYAEHGGWLAFGSEIKAVLEGAQLGREVDETALEAFLTFRYNPAPETLVRGVSKLPAGHFLTLRPGRPSGSTRSFVRARSSTVPCDTREAVDEYRRLVIAAVRRQLVADVPVGLFLSGGVDSAAIGHAMAEELGSAVPTFSVGFEGVGDYNELTDARATASHIGAEHHELVITRQDYLRFFPQSFFYTEEPVAESTISALWYVAGLAAQHLKVVLAGQGADELQAGYRRYLGARYLSSPLSRALLRGIGGPLRRLPRSMALKRAASAAEAEGEFERILRLVGIFTPLERVKLVKEDVRASWAGRETRRLETVFGDAAGLEAGLARMLYFDARTTLPDDLLLFNDKMTMAHSLEMRVPFLDRDLVAFVESVPASLKLRGWRRKYLHKRAMEGWLPVETLRRRKRGFATPVDEWFRSGLGPAARSLFASPHSGCRRFFDLDVVLRLVAEHASGREARHLQLFALLSFEIWYQTFIEQRPPAADAVMGW